MTYMNKGHRRPDGLRSVVNAATEPSAPSGSAGQADRVLVSR
ncbi:hypothetical protein ACIBG5_08760 [Kribbella sp. NPDC050241]